MILRELIKMYLLYNRGRGIKNYEISNKGYLRKGYLRFLKDGSLELGFGDNENHFFKNLDDMLSSSILLNSEGLVREFNESAIDWAREVNEALIKGIRQ